MNKNKATRRYLSLPVELWEEIDEMAMLDDRTWNDMTRVLIKLAVSNLNQPPKGKS